MRSIHSPARPGRSPGGCRRPPARAPKGARLRTAPARAGALPVDAIAGALGEPGSPTSRSPGGVPWSRLSRGRHGTGDHARPGSKKSLQDKGFLRRQRSAFRLVFVRGSLSGRLTMTRKVNHTGDHLAPSTWSQTRQGTNPPSFGDGHTSRSSPVRRPRTSWPSSAPPSTPCTIGGTTHRHVEGDVKQPG